MSAIKSAGRHFTFMRFSNASHTPRYKSAATTRKHPYPNVPYINVQIALPKPAKMALPLNSARRTMKQNKSTVIPNVSLVKINEFLLPEFLSFTL